MGSRKISRSLTCVKSRYLFLHLRPTKANPPPLTRHEQEVRGQTGQPLPSNDAFFVLSLEADQEALSLSFPFLGISALNPLLEK